MSEWVLNMLLACAIESETVVQRCSVKKECLYFDICASLLFNNVAGLRPATLLKKSDTSCEFCEIFKNNDFFNRTPPVGYAIGYWQVLE